MRVKDLFSGQSPDPRPARSKSADDIPLAFLGTIVESSDDAIISMTLDGHILSWNAGATRVFGHTRDEAMGRSIDFLIPPELHDEEQRMLERLRRGERIDHFETTRITKSGRPIQVSITISPVRDAAGLVIAFSKIARDIDSAKRAERAAAQLAAIVESSEDGIVSKSLDGIVQTWNAGATRIFGYSAEEMIGKPITTIVPPELRAEEHAILDKLRQGERINQFDTVRIHKDGRRIPTSLTISPIKDAHGAIIGAAKIARDMTERMRAKTAIRDSESRLAAEAVALAKLSEASLRLWRSASLAEGLDEIMRNAIALVGAVKGNVQIANPHAGTLSIVAHQGFDPEFLRAFESVATDDAGPACGRALVSRAPVVIEDVESDEAFAPHRAVARQAGFRAVVSVPLFASDGSMLGVVSTHFPEPHRPTEQEMRRLQLYCRQASDFIQRFRLEQTLRRSEEALREADRRKDEFLALLAHELRNPLAPIRYAIAAIAKPGLAPEQQERAVAIIERQVGHMSRLLDDLLDISRITRGSLELKKTRADLGVAIGSALEAAQPFIDAKRHVLSVDLPVNAVHLEADPVRLTQIFSNLLINAAKYTEPGGRIQLQAVEDGADVVVTVRDNGIGIPPELMPRIFTLFSQAHPAISRSEEGLGVGLALVRGLVSLHGGRVTARSEGAGRGSEFCVRLPRGREAAVAADLAGDGDAAFTGPALKILIVDDNRDAADSCASVLELSGHEVRTAYSGLRALTLAEQFRPQAILLDIGLPDVTGYEVARQIRLSDWGHKVPLVAITGWGQESDRRRAFEAGFDHHLTKPVAPETVDSLLRRIAGS